MEQKGSMVNSVIFRFDFSHFAKVDKETLINIEQFVNARIQEQLPLEENRAMPYDEALAQGATALFGEKYGCLFYTSPSPRDRQKSRMPSSA